MSSAPSPFLLGVLCWDLVFTGSELLRSLPDLDDEECFLSPFLSFLLGLSLSLSLSALLADSLLGESLGEEDFDLDEADPESLGDTDFDLEEAGPFKSLQRKLVLPSDSDLEVGVDFLSGEECFSDELFLRLSLADRSPDPLR